MAEVLRQSPDGRSRVVRDDDGSVWAEGVAEAPSGERVRVRQRIGGMVEPNPIRETRIDDLIVEAARAPEPAGLSPFEIHEAHERARRMAFARGPVKRAPWESDGGTSAYDRATPQERAQLDALRAEISAPWQQRVRVVDPTPKQPRPDVGSMSDPDTAAFVEAEAMKAASQAFEMARWV